MLAPKDPLPRIGGWERCKVSYSYNPSYRRQRKQVDRRPFLAREDNTALALMHQPAYATTPAMAHESAVDEAAQIFDRHIRLIQEQSRLIFTTRLTRASHGSHLWDCLSTMLDQCHELLGMTRTTLYELVRIPVLVVVYRSDKTCRSTRAGSVFTRRRSRTAGIQTAPSLLRERVGDLSRIS